MWPEISHVNRVLKHHRETVDNERHNSDRTYVHDIESTLLFCKINQ